MRREYLYTLKNGYFLKYILFFLAGLLNKKSGSGSGLTLQVDMAPLRHDHRPQAPLYRCTSRGACNLCHMGCAKLAHLLAPKLCRSYTHIASLYPPTYDRATACRWPERRGILALILAQFKAPIDRSLTRLRANCYLQKNRFSQ